MIRTLTFLTLFLFTLSAPIPATAQDSRTETWSGTLDAGGQKLRLEIELIRSERGELSGALRSLDQGGSRLPLSEVERDEDSLRFEVEAIGASFEGALSEEGDVVEGTFLQGGVELPLRLTTTAEPSEDVEHVLREAWVGTLELGLIEPVMQFRVVDLEGGGTTAFFDSITEGMTNFDATWSIEDDTLRFEVAAIRLTYEGALNTTGDVAEGTFRQGGRELALTLRKQATAYDDVNTWERRPQRPVGPFPYDSLEVTFENAVDGVTLAGTLTVPQAEARHPVVVLISGSGPQDRDETLLGHKPFLVLADHFSRRGIAVLRFDDRGTAASTGSYGGATTQHFANDASAAVNFLLTHPRIDPQRIGLVGHSEGGLIAPMVAAERDDIALIVLLAGPGISGYEISRSQAIAMSRAEGEDEALLEVAAIVNEAVLTTVMESESDAGVLETIQAAFDRVLATLSEEQRALIESEREALEGNLSALDGAWFRFFLNYDPAPTLARVRCPILAVIGEKDLQVLPDLNLPVLRATLETAGHPDYEVLELEGLNHLFQRCETGTLSEYAEISETFNAAAMQLVGDWISNRLGVPLRSDR